MPTLPPWTRMPASTDRCSSGLRLYLMAHLKLLYNIPQAMGAHRFPASTDRCPQDTLHGCPLAAFWGAELAAAACAMSLKLAAGLMCRVRLCQATFGGGIRLPCNCEALALV